VNEASEQVKRVCGIEASPQQRMERFSSMEKVTEVQDGWTAGQVGTLGCWWPAL